MFLGSQTCCPKARVSLQPGLNVATRKDTLPRGCITPRLPGEAPSQRAALPWELTKQNHEEMSCAWVCSGESSEAARVRPCDSAEFHRSPFLSHIHIPQRALGLHSCLFCPCWPWEGSMPR